ncbi:MAG: aminopeptidase P family protein [Thermoleophilia bacterium]|nr:aminopeptidase P family protein [Thermoleophilia bacterium]
MPETPSPLQPEDLATHRWLVPHDELRRRVAALQARLVAADIDVALVHVNADCNYVAGSILDGWVLVPAAGEPLVLARRAAERIAAETCWEVHRAPQTAALVAALRKLGCVRGRIAVALDVLPAARYLRLVAELPGAELVDLTPHVRRVRAIKSAWELALHERAARQVEDAMITVVRQVAPGHTELDAQRLAEGCLRSSGHQGVIRMRRAGGEIFFGEALAGRNAALPAFLDAPLGGSGLYPSVGMGSSTQQLVDGDLLILDFMGADNGYLSDCTRVCAVGDIDAIDHDLIVAQHWCTELLGELQAAAVPGALPSTIYALALERAADAGYGANFMGAAPDQARFVGHGVGLEVDEYPFFAHGHEAPLKVGMVFAIEPKLVFAGRAAVGIEDTFVLTGGGAVALPALPRQVLVGET